jgi:hypothetical protein
MIDLFLCGGPLTSREKLKTEYTWSSAQETEELRNAASSVG